MANEKPDVPWGVAGGLIGMGLDYATAGWQDKRARKMARFNQELAIDTWNKTNMEAQRKHMEAAGLNVGLMYKGAGPGGTTSEGAKPGQLPQESSGLGLQMGLQAQMTKAQIDLMKAQENKTNVEAKKLAGVDTEATGAATAETAARTKNLQQATDNAKIQEQILHLEKQLKWIETGIADATQQEVIHKIQLENQKLIGEAEQERNAGRMSTEAYQDLVTQIRQTTVEQQLRMAAMKAGIQETKMNTANLSRTIVNAIQHNEREWERLALSQDEIKIRKQQLAQEIIRTQFQTSTPEQIHQWTSIITDIIDSGAGVLKALK